VVAETATAIVGRMAKAFDFDGDWGRVAAILDDPRMTRALNAGMAWRCKCKGVTWEPVRGPWFYSDPPHEVPPRPRSVNWYRCYGACHCLSAWYGTIGERLFPKLEWIVAYAPDKSHSAAMGSENGRPQLVMDILWGYRSWTGRRQSKRETEEAARRIIKQLAPQGQMQSATVADAIDILEERCAGHGS
jgi:hypothetical protein